MTLQRPLQTLRIDELQLRGYGVGESKDHAYAPIVDLRGNEPTLVGSHAIADWVLRQDSRSFSAQRRADHTIEIARVIR